MALGLARSCSTRVASRTQHPLPWVFLIRVRELEKELIIVDINEIDNGLLVTDILPFFWDLGHLFVTVGDHPDESGGKIAKAWLSSVRGPVGSTRAC